MTIAFQEHLAWRSRFTLARACELIGQRLKLPDMRFDSGNALEWATCEVDRIEYNLTRPSGARNLRERDASVPAGCNFGLCLSVRDNHSYARLPERFLSDVLRPVGRALAAELGTTVHYHRRLYGPGQNSYVREQFDSLRAGQQLVNAS